MSYEWITPPEIFNPLMEEFAFDLDAAATEKTRRIPRYLDNALTLQEWPGKRIWLNPPYGKLLSAFIWKAAHEAEKEKVIVALIPLRSLSVWWYENIIGRAAELRIVRKRIRFLDINGKRANGTSSSESCIIVWNGENKSGITALSLWNPPENTSVML